MRNKTLFTHGPWKVLKSISKSAYNVVGTNLGRKWKIARCPFVNEGEEEEAKANAILMATAPEMFNHLKDSLTDLRELKEWYERDAESFDHPANKQERRMCLDNAKAVEYRIIQIKEVLTKAQGGHQ